jgi:Ca-activated chloride channel family protein
MPGLGDSLRPRLFLLLLCSVWLASLGAGQIAPPRFLPPPPPPGDFDMVLSYVTVTAAKNAEAPRLPQDKIHIFEDNKEQKIDYFALHNQPVSVGIVWGAGTGFDGVAPDPDVRECPRAFVRNSVPGSEFFLLAGDTVTTSYTTEPTRLPMNFAWSGSSSDSLFIGMDVLKEAANPRKLLLVITTAGGGGGGQLQSDYVQRSAIRLGSTQVHVLSFWSGADVREINHEGSIFFSEMAELTGGSYYMGPVASSTCPNLAKELRQQYLVGYHSTNAAKDGKWRKLSVKVDALDGGPKLSARIKRGYYAQKSSTR